jgi:hypothetical protein
VILVPLTTETLLTVTPLPPVIPTVAPETKFVPVRVTLTAVPWTPFAGLTLVRVGVAEEVFTVNI